MRCRGMAGVRRGPGRCQGGGGAGHPGFSLLELIVVMAILAVVAAATAPALRLGSSEEAALDAATRRLSTIFRMARDSAVQGAAPVTVVLDPAYGVYWLEVEQPSTFVSHAGEVRRFGDRTVVQRAIAPQPMAIVPTPLELPAGVRIESPSRLHFVFRVNGSVFGDSVMVRNSTELRIVHLNPWTGDVVVR